MKILAIDTSNQPLSVAVLEDGNLLSQATCTKTKNHSVKLLPLIERLMEDARLKPCELDRIVVAKGPGSYTGLRIGVATAKTLAYTLDKELAGVSSLEVLAAAFPKTEKSVLVPLFDARRGNVFAGAYRYDENGLLQTVMSDRHIAVADLCEEFASQNVIFVGRDAQAYSDLINEKCKKGTISSFGFNYPRADILGMLGEKEKCVDVNDFVPNYLRMTQAEAQWLEKHPEGKDEHDPYVEKI